MKYNIFLSGGFNKTPNKQIEPSAHLPKALVACPAMLKARRGGKNKTRESWRCEKRKI